MTPPHAYRPGQTPRHPEGAFDALRATAEDGLSSKAYHLGLDWLEQGYFWEAHELLEPVWMAAPPNSAERLMLRGLIQLANARLKAAMGRKAASDRLMLIAARDLTEAERRGAPIPPLARTDAEAFMQNNADKEREKSH
ncbi:MAG: DUF309 domain-containing protein [Paracoccus sp. (in: a-proteobacteria)]|nr:DUF309 domain-containing protein [Paracoccus sp. (in: a-proteobacteria)]